MLYVQIFAKPRRVASRRFRNGRSWWVIGGELPDLPVGRRDPVIAA